MYGYAREARCLGCLMQYTSNVLSGHGDRTKISGSLDLHFPEVLVVCGQHLQTHLLLPRGGCALTSHHPRCSPLGVIFDVSSDTTTPSVYPHSYHNHQGAAGRSSRA